MDHVWPLHSSPCCHQATLLTLTCPLTPLAYVQTIPLILRSNRKKSQRSVNLCGGVQSCQRQQFKKWVQTSAKWLQWKNRKHGVIKAAALPSLSLCRNKRQLEHDSYASPSTYRLKYVPFSKTMTQGSEYQTCMIKAHPPCFPTCMVCPVHSHKPGSFIRSFLRNPACDNPLLRSNQVFVLFSGFCPLHLNSCFFLSPLSTWYLSTLPPTKHTPTHTYKQTNTDR